ncbi:LysR family transcriptional regulator [Brevibacterium aurantiacum]|nr:LysR substrate-binding domain-containing protein [Brevibacterium aurantiacum]
MMDCSEKRKSVCVELRQLEYFMAVAEELHFGRAAERLHISQPPLTTHIKRLEAEIRVKLFDRTTRKVSLTMPGTVLYDQLRPVLRDLYEAVAEAHSAGKGHGGLLRVGFTSSANYALLPRAVRSFRVARPNVRLDLLPLTTAEQINALVRGELDLGILRDPSPNALLRFSHAVTESLVAVFPDDHYLAYRDYVEAHELIDLPMILFPFSTMPGFVTTVLSVFLNESRAPEIVQEAVHQETIMGLVASGMGFSILSNSISYTHVHGTRAVPLFPAKQTSLIVAEPVGAEVATVDKFVACLEETKANEG